MQKDRGNCAPARIYEFDELPSTSSEAARMAAAGDCGPLWVLAHHQTRGRGRSGRTWLTARGNLAISHLFAPKCDAAALPQLSILAGVAAISALSEFWPEGAAERRLRLKWPNDLMIDRAKIGGLLVETTRLGDLQLSTVGIGVNLAHAPKVEGREVDCLGRHVSGPLELRPIAEALARQFSRWQGIWDRSHGFGAVREAWLERAGPIGEPISVNATDIAIAGTFQGLDSDGALLFADVDGVRHRVTFGDVTLTPSAKA
jgi:BirA family biotin operon repressor/biotin-[acetyl-CoA-carboxylase] ligase